MFSVLNFGNGLFPLFWHLSKPIAKIQPQIEINEINPFHPQEAGQCLSADSRMTKTQKQKYLRKRPGK